VESSEDDEHAALVPQPPQCCGSLEISTQRSLQSVRGGVHEDAHPEGVQRLSGAAHVTAQLPQDMGLERLASHPSLGSWLQSAHPGSQEPTPHPPFEQIATACASWQGKHGSKLAVVRDGLLQP
jgi:hypothetical protein